MAREDGVTAMANKTEVLEAIRQGTADVVRTFGPLSEDQLGMRVHQAEGGWTAKEVLAHLAAGQAMYERMLQRAVEGEPIFGGPGSMDERNHQLVGEYVSKSKGELLAAFQAGQEALGLRVQAAPDNLLARLILLPRGGERALADLLIMIGGRHASGHAQEVEQALAAPAAG